MEWNLQTSAIMLNDTKRLLSKLGLFSSLWSSADQTCQTAKAALLMWLEAASRAVSERQSDSGAWALLSQSRPCQLLSCSPHTSCCVLPYPTSLTQAGPGTFTRG